MKTIPSKTVVCVLCTIILANIESYKKRYGFESVNRICEIFELKTFKYTNKSGVQQSQHFVISNEKKKKISESFPSTTKFHQFPFDVDDN